MTIIEQILKHETAGDPISGLKWTHKAVRKITAELNKIGIDIGKDTVAKLLKDAGFALRVNHKKLSGGKYSSPAAREKRDSQFEYIKVLRNRFEREGMPSISVDTKKKEMVGLFKNAGESWEKRPVPVNDHDFPSLAEGKAVPYGIYDFLANRGSVFVGVSHDTADFATDSVVQWWSKEGRKRYPEATKLLILADSGGSNGVRSRVWKYELHRQLACRYGIEVTVAHYPPGTSKWNPVEHRLFSEISKNWKSVPLSSFETILKYIRTTKTSTGLKVKSYLNKRKYKTGRKISNAQMKELAIVKHETNPEWNYTLNSTEPKKYRPQTQREAQLQELEELLEKNKKAIVELKSRIEAFSVLKM